MASEEFLQRREYWPSVVTTAKKIMELHAKEVQDKAPKSADHEGINA